MNAGAERQHACAAAVGGDVELGLLQGESAAAGSRTGAVAPELLLVAGTGFPAAMFPEGSLCDTEGSHRAGAGALLTAAR